MHPSTIDENTIMPSITSIARTVAPEFMPVSIEVAAIAQVVVFMN